ncbi:hypothetical protein D3C71_1135070 [compost metagenome]
MTDQSSAAPAAEQDPLTDEYVNAVIRQHGYDSPETVIARLWQWIGLNGSQNGVTLLMYEAHKALSKLRPEGVQAGEPESLRKAVAIVDTLESAAAEWGGWSGTKSACEGLRHILVHSALAWDQRNKDFSALASAPVAGEAHMPPGYRVKAVDGHGYRITPPTGSDWVAHSDTPAGDLVAALLAAPQASEAVLPAPCHDLRYHDQYRVGWNRCLDACRAALAAQPGAQKGHDPLPTETMVGVGFEAVSCFQDTDAYKAMTGCQQAAESARVCWAAMVEAMPEGSRPNQDAPPTDEALLGLWVEALWPIGDICESKETVLRFARQTLARFGASKPHPKQHNDGGAVYG